MKKKKKKKKKSQSKEISSSVDHFPNVLSDISPVNRPYSDVDYFPLMPGALSHPINQQRISTHSGKDIVFSFFVFLEICDLLDTTSDCYINPLEIVQTNRVFQIPVIDCREEEEEQVLKYKDIDHARTRALREVVQERNQDKFV